MLMTLCGCEKKEDSQVDSSISEIQQETFQPDPYAENNGKRKPINSSEKTSATTSAEITSATTIQTATEITTTVSGNSEIQSDTVQQPDPMGGGAFSYDEDGAVSFEEELPQDDDQLLISAGQAVFESACHTQWFFTVGCPYEIDTASTIQNDYGWTYYKITDGNIKSLADVENDYYKVFSDRYPNEDLKVLYLEHDGSVYALNGQRGMNIYYSFSRIIGIQSKTDDEIFYTVENQFEGSDLNPDVPYSETETFSVVLDGNKIRAGQFRLPY